METLAKTQSAIENKVQELIVKVKELYPGILGDPLTGVDDSYTLRFDLKGRCAGNATYSWVGSSWVLRFNLEIARRNLKLFLERTPGHELAHVVSYRLHSHSRGHSRYWKMVCMVLTGQCSRCHAYDLSFLGGNTNKFLYRCVVCGAKLYFSKRRHNNAMQFLARGQEPYLHKQDRGALVLESTYLKNHSEVVQVKYAASVAESSDYVLKNLELATSRYRENSTSRRKKSLEKWRDRAKKLGS